MEEENKDKTKLDKFSEWFKSLPTHKKLLYKVFFYIITAFIFALLFTFFTKPSEWKGEIKVLQQSLPKNGNMLSYFQDMFHYSIDTFSTVGFGDIIPVSKLSRGLTHFLMILSFSIIVM